MKITRAGGCLVPGLLALAAATAAPAQERGFYVGASMGAADFPDDANLNAFGVDLRTDEDSPFNELALSLDAGFRFNRWFAAEIGYVDLGEAALKLTDPTGNNAGEGEIRYGVHGPTVSFVGFMPLGKWEPFLKVGVIFPDVELAVGGTAAAMPFSLRRESDSARPFYGVGVGYHFNERWKMKLEINYYDGLGDGDSTGTANILSAMLGFTYKF
jgi:opacity protein-like surface antigen